MSTPPEALQDPSSPTPMLGPLFGETQIADADMVAISRFVHASDDFENQHVENPSLGAGGVHQVIASPNTGNGNDGELQDQQPHSAQDEEMQDAPVHENGINNHDSNGDKDGPTPSSEDQFSGTAHGQKRGPDGEAPNGSKKLRTQDPVPFPLPNTVTGHNDNEHQTEDTPKKLAAIVLLVEDLPRIISLRFFKLPAAKQTQVLRDSLVSSQVIELPCPTMPGLLTWLAQLKEQSTSYQPDAVRLHQHAAQMWYGENIFQAKGPSAIRDFIQGLSPEESEQLRHLRILPPKNKGIAALRHLISTVNEIIPKGCHIEVPVIVGTTSNKHTIWTTDPETTSREASRAADSAVKATADKYKRGPHA